MTALDITDSAVIATADTRTSRGTAGFVGEAGDAVYLDSATNTLKGAANSSAAAANIVGILLSPSFAGQPVTYATSGSITLGSVLAQGESYMVAATEGGIEPQDETGASAYRTLVGVATSATVLKLNILASGVQKA